MPNPFQPDFADYVVVLGLNGDIDTGTEEVVPVTRGTLPTNEFVASIASSDNTNDKAAGTGALTATIRGIEKTTYLAKEETVTLNGTGAVTTTQKFIRINSVEVATAGSAGVNAGTLTTSLNSQAMDTVPVGMNRSHQATYAVPAATSAVIDRIVVGVEVAASAVRFEYRSIATITAPGPWKIFNLGTLQATVEKGTFEYNISGAIVVPPKSEFRVQITSLADNSVASAAVFFGLRPA